MKLIIQIPCKDEAEQLPATLADLPRQLPGFDSIEVLVIDDGSTDDTIAVARDHGVSHIVRLTNNKGLASAFQAGMDAALKLGADVIVNTDADNQYRGEDIARLVAPIVAGQADMVIGDRDVVSVQHFSPLKKRLQRLGSSVVRLASSTNVPDTTSGFRAYNREAALQIMIVSRFTYTLESIIQSGKQLVAIDHVPIRTNPQTRPSRLFPSMWSYVRRNAISIFRIYAQYEPLRVFLSAAGLLLLAALAVWIRFIVAYAAGQGLGPRAVADPGRGALQRRRRRRRARRDRRPVERAADDDPAHPRARPPDRAARSASSRRTTSRSPRRRRSRPTAATATARRACPRRPARDVGHALGRRHRHGQHLRQIQHPQSDSTALTARI